MKRKNNTMQIQLPDGDSVTIRKVSNKTLGLLASNTLMQSGALMRIAQQNAKEASHDLQTMTGIPSRPPSNEPDKLMEATIIEATLQIQRGAIKYGLVEPKFAELLEAYGGSEDLPDYGLGDDFDLIAQSIVAFSEGGEAAAEEVARAFLGKHGDPAGLDGGTVPSAAESTAGPDA